MILVTGGTGFIGRHLVPALVRRAEPVRLLVRDEERARGLPAEAERVRGDLTDAASVAAALEGARAVVHLAAVMDGVSEHAAGMQAANVNGTRELVRAASVARVEHFVHVSSAGVYGSRTTREPFTELDEPQPATAYERTKLEAERVVRDEASAWTVLRPTGVVGPGRPQTDAFVRTVASRRVWFFGGTDTLFNPVFVDDVVASIVLALDSDRARGEIINVGGASVVSYRALIRLTAKALGTPTYHLRVPHTLTRSGAALAGTLFGVVGRPLPARLAGMRQPVINRVASIDKARWLGVTPTPIEAAMSATVDHFRGPRGD